MECPVYPNTSQEAIAPEPNIPAMDTSMDTSMNTCNEFNNIKYKIRLLNTSTKVAPLSKGTTSVHTNSYDTLQRFLDDEKIKNKFEAWNKLNKSIKYKKIHEYVYIYTQANKLIEDESILLLEYLTAKINTGQLARAKDVMYDKSTGVIRDIPGIIFNRDTRHITMKYTENRRITTVKNVKTLLKNKCEDII